MLTSGAPDRSHRVGLAMAGGGPEGAVYEIGVLRALDEALAGIDFTRLPVYVGVSAGAFLAANLANGISTAENVRAIVKHEPGEHPFTPQTFFRPNVGEMFRRTMMMPGLFLESLWDYARRPNDLSILDSLTRLSRALPVGLFDNEPIRAYLEKIYGIKGRTDDFRTLRSQLYVVATELDSGRAVRFGDSGLDHVPISRAVQASAALPGLYPPVLIEGRHYVDGVLLKTMHASVALEKGADLVICINPIVPVDMLRSRDLPQHRRQLTAQGLPTVMSQTFRTLIHSRMTVGMAAYAPRFPSQDLVLFEPQPDDYRMFFTNIFSFSSRRTVCEYAYRATRRDLLHRYDELAPIFARNKIELVKSVLLDPSRDIWRGVGLEAGHRENDQMRDIPVAAKLDRLLTSLEAWAATRHVAARTAPPPRGAAAASRPRSRRRA